MDSLLLETILAPLPTDAFVCFVNVLRVVEVKLCMPFLLAALHEHGVTVSNEQIVDVVLARILNHCRC